MEPAAIVAEIPEPQAHGLHFPYLNLNINPTYNISLNFSSLLSMIPGSRLLKRLRRSAGFTLFDESSHVQVGFGEGLSSLETVDAFGKAETASMVEAWATQVGQMAQAAEGAGQGHVHSSQQQAERLTSRTTLPLFPAPAGWEFFTSGYVLGLFIMAILLHRMHNLIIPSPRSRPNRSRRAYRSSMHHQADSSWSFSSLNSMWERLHAQILPVDFSKTTTRLILHIPSVYFLLKVLVQWTILVLQTCEVLPTLTALEQRQSVAASWGFSASDMTINLAKWALEKDMSRVCWSTFCAVCGAFLVEGFIKSLHGLGTGGFHVGNVNGMTPFHLVSYALLLHIYSSPLAHGFHPSDNSPSRPDRHAVITITIALFQLSMFHILSISKRLSTHRLLPTTLTSILSLIHFHTTVLAHLMDPLPRTYQTPTSTIPSPTPTSLPSPSPFDTTRPRRPLPFYLSANTSYPLLNYVPNAVETILLATIILTIALNAVAQLLVRGRVDRLFSGLGLGGGSNDPESNSIRSIIANLPHEEDFIIVLLRIGVASLEATGLRGWANEVAPIKRVRVKARRRHRHQLLSSSGGRAADIRQDSYGRVMIGRMDVGDIGYAVSATASGPSSSTLTTARNRRPIAGTTLPPPPNIKIVQRRGFLNEVRNIDLGHSRHRGSPDQGTQSSPSWRTLVAAWQFVVVLAGVLKGLCTLILGNIRRRALGADVGRGPQEDDSEGLVEEEQAVEQEHEQLLEQEGALWDAELYQRFLRGEDISDDEDAAGYEDDDNSQDQQSEGLSEDDTDELDANSDTRDAETFSLFADLLRGGSRSRYSSPTPHDFRTQTPAIGASSEMVLAHFMHGQSAPLSSSTSPGPLTRKTWDALRGSHQSGLDSWSRTELSPELGRYRQTAPLNFDVATMDSDDDVSEQKDKEIGLLHVCVVCMLEAREVICWPCRCLAMCDGCRETLASQSSASKHRCPCCRQIAEGYSKIYIP